MRVGWGGAVSPPQHTALAAMHPEFDLPSQGNIKGRSSSITAAFIQSIIPVVEPEDSEVDRAISILGMKPGKVVCAYCGDPRTEWDHFRPIVMNKRPTGYITELANLVPACGKCNQSKGNKDWEVWILSSAKRSPKTRGIIDLDQRIERLRLYESTFEPMKLDFEAVVGPEMYQQHWSNWESIVTAMETAQQFAVQVRKRISDSDS